MSKKITQLISYIRCFINPNEYSFMGVWENISFPNRPTEKEIEIYRTFAAGASGEIPRILILGATPELRDLAAGIKMQAFVCDASPLMPYGMAKFLRFAKTKDEIWIKANWLDVPFEDNFFDIIAGDLSLRHVDPQTQERFLNKIYRILKPGGRLIIRTHIINPAYQERSYRDILDEAMTLPYAKKKYEAMGVLLSRLFDSSTKDKKVNLEEIRSEVRNYISIYNPPFSYRLFLYEFITKRLNHYYLNPASQSREEAEELLNKFFRILGVEHDGTYPESEFYPIYNLEKHAIVFGKN